MRPFFPELAAPPAEPPPPPRLRFIDLFAGIGGIRSGLEAKGVDGRCVYTVEFDRWAMQTYSANFGELDPDGNRIPEPPRDIFDIRPNEVPPYDLLAAGFPCQPFSLAGVSKNLSLGREHGFGHEKSGNLFFQIARLVQDAPIPPGVLFLENVKHLVRHDGGNTFKVIMATLDDLGYNVTWQVIDASPWVPQKRERTFIVGLHRDVYGEQEFEFPTRSSTRRGRGQCWHPCSSPDRWTTSTPSRPTCGAIAGLREEASGSGKRVRVSKFGPEDRARTLSARYHKDGSEILIQTDKPQPRRLTPRECARLMGYPDSFVIPVSDTQAYRQFGNSVVVPVIRFLAAALVEQVAFAEVATRG